MGTEQTHGIREFRRIWWQPPRAHGEAGDGRTVSFLELFYDLVYVAVIAQAAHHLSHHISWRGTLDFAIVFALIWIAWLNGTTYHDVHGRPDGRSRTFIFLQMGLLALLAVFTAEAGGEDGKEFAVVYTLYLVVLTWLWYVVRRIDPEEYMASTGRYLTGMFAAIAIMATSIFLPDDLRMVAWGLLVVGWVTGMAFYEGRLIDDGGEDYRLAPTESLIERFGLFTIIVLGEVVVGVVNGISDSDRTPMAVTTGMLAMVLGFAFWWSYFDYVGGRRTAERTGAFFHWGLGHLPATMGIAAAGAATVPLIEHHGDARSPEGAAWLLAGSVAVALVSLVSIMPSLKDWGAFPSVFRPTSIAVTAAAAGSIAIGLIRPSPWLMILLLSLLLSATWGFWVARWMSSREPGEMIPSFWD